MGSDSEAAHYGDASLASAMGCHTVVHDGYVVAFVHATGLITWRAGKDYDGTPGVLDALAEAFRRAATEAREGCAGTYEPRAVEVDDDPH